jgi:hypothetical protein
MTVFLVTLVLVAVGVFGMCFNIIFRKDGAFPEYEVGSNKEMRKLGIRCMKEEMAEMDRKERPVHASCTGSSDPSCEGCSLYNKA